MIPIPGSYQYHTDSVDPRYAVRKLLGLSTLPYALGADIRQAVRCLHWSVAIPRQSVDPRYAVRSSQTQLLETCVLGCRRGRMCLVQRFGYCGALLEI